MDFWSSYDNQSFLAEFGSARTYIGTKPRPHASVHSIYKKAVKLDVNDGFSSSFDPNGTRYIIAENVTFDIFCSIYDVNTTRTFAARTTPNYLPNKISADFKKFLSQIKKPNLEIRIIGSQNDTNQASSIISSLRKLSNAGLTELDIFGNEMRHVCFDMKTGIAYNLLLENRHYRPGELINTTSKKDFDEKYVPVQAPAAKHK